MIGYITHNAYITYSFCAVTFAVWLIAMFHLLKKSDFSSIGKFWFVVVLIVPCGSWAYFAWIKFKKMLNADNTAGTE